MSSFPKNTSGGDPQAPFLPRPPTDAERIDQLDNILAHYVDKVNALERAVRKLEGLRELDAAAIESHERRLATAEWRLQSLERHWGTPAGLMEGADTLTGRDILRVQYELIPAPAATPRFHHPKFPTDYYAVDKPAESQPAARPRRWWRLWT